MDWLAAGSLRDGDASRAALHCLSRLLLLGTMPRSHSRPERQRCLFILGCRKHIGLQPGLRDVRGFACTGTACVLQKACCMLKDLTLCVAAGPRVLRPMHSERAPA